GWPVGGGQAALEAPAAQLAGERRDLVGVAGGEDVGHLAVTGGPLLRQRDAAVLEALQDALDLLLGEGGTEPGAERGVDGHVRARRSVGELDLVVLLDGAAHRAVGGAFHHAHTVGGKHDLVAALERLRWVFQRGSLPSSGRPPAWPTARIARDSVGAVCRVLPASWAAIVVATRVTLTCTMLPDESTSCTT